MDSGRLIDIAKQQGRNDIAEWIKAEIEKDLAEKAARLAQPIDTPLGPLVPGRRYIVTMTGYQGRGRTVLRGVTPERSEWGGGRLIYSSGKTARHLFEYDVKRIVSIEEIAP